MGRVEQLAATSVTIGLLTVAGLWVFLALFINIDAGEVLHRIDPVFMLLAILLHAAFWALWALRTWVLSRGIGIAISPERALAVVLSSLFAASITPSYAGGEPVRFYLLSDQEAGSGGRAGSVVFTERFLDITFFGAISMVSGLYLYAALGIPILKWVFLSAGLLIAGALVVFTISIRSKSALDTVLKAALAPVGAVRPGLALRIKQRVDMGTDDFHASLSTFVGRGRLVLLAAAALTCAQWAAEFLVPYVLFVGLGAEIGLLEVVAGNAVLTVLLMVPVTPGGSGLAEVGAVGVYGLFEKSPAVAFFPLPWRLVTYYTNLGVGLAVSALLLKDMDAVQDALDNLR